jgi:hypothetical protein
MKRKKIVVMGFMGGCPIAGVVWQHIHYIAGLQRLGHEVWYIEDSARIPYNPSTFAVENDFTYAAQVLDRLAREHGFENRWGFCARYLPDHDCAGLTKEKIVTLYREADAIFNICGSQEFNEDLLRSERILYVESDPGLEQIHVDQNHADAIDYLKRHHALFTFGENVGTAEFPVPTHGFTWLPTRQPIVTDYWNTGEPPSAGAVFTSIANWSTSGRKDIEWRGDTYLWSKSLEFERFVEAPARSGEEFELATDIQDKNTRNLFLENRWRFIPPHDLSADWNRYRRYVQDSKGEFTAAKDQYVRLNTGWFSDRTACYLAAGRPAITQETGFTKFYGGEGGLFAFRTLDDIAAAVEEINRNYARHSRLALEIAKEFFEAEKVLAMLLNRANC